MSARQHCGCGERSYDSDAPDEEDEEEEDDEEEGGIYLCFIIFCTTLLLDRPIKIDNQDNCKIQSVFCFNEKKIKA